MNREKKTSESEAEKREVNRALYSVCTLVKGLVTGSGIGVLVGLVCGIFGRLLIEANAFRVENRWIVWLLPLAGLVIVFLYKFFRNTHDTGTNMVISSIHSSTDIPLKMAPLIFVSTILTHLCGGSAGREGAAIQLGGSISNAVGKVFKLNDNDQRIIIMSGISAGFAALFGTPMAAAIFALEVISIGIMHYSALVSCVTAAMMARFVAQRFGVEPEFFPVAEVPAMDPAVFLKIVFFAALAGGVSILFCIILHSTEHLYKKHIKNQYVRIFLSGCLILLLTGLLGTDEYLGSGRMLIEEIFHTQKTGYFTFLIKMIFTALTLGAGYKGGEIIPSFCIGAAFGCMAATVFGLPVSLVTACGMVGLFCGVTNCPITSLLISFELFGFDGMPYYLVTVAVSYMLSGYYGLYRAQKIMYSKTETNFVNKAAH
ncbi:MAG: chloride channel protein [Lachnospiraceae bacterium]|nr:chloride channel protein [Lachnospiraceae bacterium]